MATFASIVESMINYIRSKNSVADTSVGTLLRDIVIDCPANEINDLYTEAEGAEKVAAFYTYSSDLTIAQMDNIADNWGLTRNGAVAATGQIRFAKTSIPTAITTIVAGTAVSTTSSSGQAAITFTTQAEVSMSSASYSYDSVTGYYYVEADVECSTSGAEGNVGANTITIYSGISGIDLVYNPLPMSGGADAESSSSLAGRIRTKLMGNNYGTENGYESIVSTLSTVSEVSVSGPNDPEMLRSSYGGKIDIGLRPASLAAGLSSYTENKAYVSTDPIYTLSKPPVRALSSVTGIVASIAHTFVVGTDCELTKDPGENSGSIRAGDKIIWLGVTEPDDGTTFTVTYTYFSTVEDAQDLLDDDSTHILTADALAREAESVRVNATFTVGKLSGYSNATVSSNVVTAFANYVNSLLMGADLDESDLVAAIYDNTSGIDNILLPFTVFTKTDLSGTYNAINGRLSVTKNQYFAVGTLTITIT